MSDIVSAFKAMSMKEQQSLVVQLTEIILKEQNLISKQNICRWRDILMDYAKRAVGITDYDPNSRIPENCMVRDMVMVELLREGVGTTTAARLVCRNHSSATNARKKIEGMFEVPNAFKKEIAIWQKFQNYINHETDR